MQMSRFSMVLATAILFSSLVSPPQALAGEKEQAIKLFSEGNELRVAEKYAEALEKYRAAYKLLPSFKIEYNTALVLDKMGNHPAAYMTYKSFLKSGAGKSPERILQTAQDRIAKLKKKIALVKVKSSVSGSTVKLNGINVGKTPLSDDWEMAVKAPKTVGVRVEAQGFQTYTKAMPLKAGQEITVAATLQPMPKPTPAQLVTKAPGSVSRPELSAKSEKPRRPATTVAGHDADGELEYQHNQKRRSKSIWAWTTLGVGLACAVGAGVMYGVGSSQVNSAYDEYNALTAADSAETFDEKWANVESAGNLYIGGHVLAGVAAAAVGVSIYMFVTRPSGESAEEVASQGLNVGVAADSQGAGLLISGEF